MPDFLSEALTWSENYHILIAVETAIDLKLPPTEFLDPSKKPTGEWSGLDKKLAMALRIKERETCKLCGNPIWICRSEDRDIDFSIRTGTCHSKQRLEKKEKQRSKQKNGDLKEGQYLYSVPMKVNGSEIEHGARERYFKSLSEE